MMPHGRTFPVLTQAECRQMLDHTKGIGPVRVPWEFVTMLTAVVMTASSLALLMLHSWVASVIGAVLLATAMLLFQVVLHECAHHALFRSRVMNALAGWLIGLLVLTPFFSFRRGHVVHHTCLGADDDPTAAPRDSRRRHWLIEILLKLRVVPVLYLGGVYGPYLFYDLLPRANEPQRRLVQYGLNLLAILGLHAALAWTFGGHRYLPFLLAAFWLAGIFYEYLFTQNQHVGLLPGPETGHRYRHREQVNFSRSIRLPCAGLFMYFNLHKEHHLFPQLPCRYLPRIHVWLQEHRSDVLAFTSEHLGIVQRRQDLKLFTPTIGDHDD